MLALWIGAFALADALPAQTTRDATSANARALELTDALRLALKASPTLRIARDQVRVEHGTLVVARSAFDATLESSLVGGRYDELDLGLVAGSTLNNISTSRRETIDYRLALQKQFASGIVLAPSVNVSQVGQAALGQTPVNRAAAGLTAIVPLARNRAGGIAIQQQRAAEQALDAAEFERRQTTAETMLNVGFAYWDYAAAAERLAALRYSESRALTLVDETAELVKGDARPAADLIQFRGNLASKRAQRVSAEQALARARQQLGIVLGIPPEEIVALPPARLDIAGTAAPYDPVTGTVVVMPDVPEATIADPDAAGATWAHAQVTEILKLRPDVRAARARSASAAQELRAARNGLRPQMDLQLSFAYAGLDRGVGLGDFVAPLWRNTRGATTTVQLQYSLPTRNLAARGRAEQAEALMAQASTVERDRVRQVEAALAVAAAGAHRGRTALLDAATAVRIARDVVENEKQKFRLGVSTQIDVIFAEDALTSALVNEISARASYAAAVGVLRLESGALAAAGDDSATLARLLSTDSDLRRQP